MASTIIDEIRFAELANRSLQAGAHHNIEDGMCAMEAASYISGEPWSDHPECVSPVIAAFVRKWNDNLSTDERDQLITPAIIAMTIGTTRPQVLEQQRSLLAADWLIRAHTATWLRLAGFDNQAGIVTGLPEITDTALYPAICASLEVVQKKTIAEWEAAWGTAWETSAGIPWDVAWDATWAAAWEAAWDITGAPYAAAAGDAAQSCMRVAALLSTAAAAAAAVKAATAACGWADASEAARSTLRPTRDRLQNAASEFVERMCVCCMLPPP